jgi:membrane dipeptidase
MSWRCGSAGTCALLSVEGGDILEGDISVLRLLHRLGVRMFGLCWSLTNEIATGCGDDNDAGLKDFGREVVAECGRLRMMVDLSHASDRTFWDVLDCAKAPVCASHSCARALCPDQRRNLTDEMLEAIGKAGGYVGVNFCQPFLIGGGPKDRHVGVEDVARHLEHMAAVAGVEVLGVGSDYDGISRTPVGLEDCSKLGNLAETLLRRNWKERDVRGVMGENFLRYWARVRKDAVGAVDG